MRYQLTEAQILCCGLILSVWRSVLFDVQFGILFVLPGNEVGPCEFLFSFLKLLMLILHKTKNRDISGMLSLIFITECAYAVWLNI